MEQARAAAPGHPRLRLGPAVARHRAGHHAAALGTVDAVLADVGAGPHPQRVLALAVRALATLGLGDAEAGRAALAEGRAEAAALGGVHPRTMKLLDEAAAGLERLPAASRAAGG